MEIVSIKAGIAGVLVAGIAGASVFVGVGFMGSTIDTSSCQSPSPAPSSTVVTPEDVSLTSASGIPSVPNSATGETIPLTGETLQDAKLIAGVGFALENQLDKAGQSSVLTDSDVAAAEMGSMGETRLLNLPSGDRDSAGLFQQRPSVLGGNGLPYWGTAEQVRNPIYAINRFYKELLMRKTEAAAAGITLQPWELVQKVQASGNPAGYQPWYGQAVAIVKALKPSSATVQTAVQVSDTTVTAQAAMADNCQGQEGTTTPDTVTGPASKQGWHVPLTGNFIITQGYGRDNGGTGHPGDDLSDGNFYSRPILAAADGVTYPHNPDPGGFGNYVELTHAGNIQTIYGHMARLAPGMDKFGVPVKAGQVIGYADSTGDSTGNHLHFEVHVNGATVNPVTFMLARGINLAGYGGAGVQAA